MAIVKTQGTAVAIETVLATTKAISGITAANPCVVSATGHGYTVGQIVKLANIAGMVELNDRAFVVSNPLTGTFELKGVDSTSYSAYVSGGDSYLATMTAVGTVEGVPTLFAGTAQVIKTTHLKSVREEQIMGLGVAGTVSLTLQLQDTDAGQAAMQLANELQQAKCYTFTRPDGKVACCVAFCDSFQIAAAANDIYRATASLLLRAAQTRFA